MKKHVSNLIASLAAKEDAFLRTRFVAPIAGEGVVQVRIAGAVCRLRIRPRRFIGWGVFAPMSYTDAVLDRAATMAERRAYLALWPSLRLVMLDGRRAIPGRLSDKRFAIDGEAIVLDVQDAEPFDTIIARFDGQRFWFDEPDPQADPAAAAYLREAIVAMRPPRQLDRPGLTPEQRLAYAAEHDRRVREEIERQKLTDEGRLQTALEHAGARLTSFSEVQDVYRVSYVVDGRRHTSVVRKGDLAIASAGVCLSGEDQKFDLTSLVSVLREGQKIGIHHSVQV